MFVRDWPELLSEVSDLEAPADVTPYVMARISAAHAHPSPKRHRGVRRGRLASLPIGWFAAAAGGVIVLGLLALAAHSREHERPVGAQPQLVHYRGHGVEFTYPAAWRYQHSGVITQMTSPVIDLSTQPMGDPCHGKLGCGWPVTQLRPGGVVLMVFSGGELVAPTSTGRTIREYHGDRLDGLAASIGCDRVLVGDYATPAFGHLSFSACFRAPGMAAHEREFRAMLASARPSSGYPSSRTGTVAGRVVVKGGVQFPHRKKPPPATNTRLTFVAIPASGPMVVRHLKTDAEGGFRLDLPPGRYRVGCTFVASEPLAQAARQSIVLRAGQVVHVRLTESVM